MCVCSKVSISLKERTEDNCDVCVLFQGASISLKEVTEDNNVRCVLCFPGFCHESKGVTEDYLRLEALVQKVVSPYLGTHGLYSNDGSSMHYSSCVLEKRLQRRWLKPGDAPSKNLVVRSKSYNVPMLTPVVEYDAETGSVSSMGIRRHSICEMTSCLEEGATKTDHHHSSPGHPRPSRAYNPGAGAQPDSGGRWWKSGSLWVCGVWVFGVPTCFKLRKCSARNELWVCIPNGTLFLT
ncbi:unnamed protein product [Coregonus sp. 'balchen']|nr:unnamed protein product [Coregonus sp. 'balchen']